MLLRRSVITSFALLKSLSTLLVVLQTCFVERYFEDVRIVRAFLKSLICDGVFLPFLTHSHNHEKAPQLQHNIFYNIFYMQYDISYYSLYMYVLWYGLPRLSRNWKNKKNEANFHTAKESTLFCQGDEGVGTGHRL